MDNQTENETRRITKHRPYTGFIPPKPPGDDVVIMEKKDFYLDDFSNALVLLGGDEWGMMDWMFDDPVYVYCKDE